MNNRKGVSLSFVFIAILIILAGCNDISGFNSSQPSQNNTPTSVAETNNSELTDTQTPTPTSDSTSTPENETEIIKPSDNDSFSHFRDGYVSGLEENGVNVTNSSIQGDDKILNLTYQMSDPSNDRYTGRERENISWGYVEGVEYYIDENRSSAGKSWIPRRVNVTATTPDGQVYETAYTTYDRAKKMIEGEYSPFRYLVEYYGTIEPGPANPEYEG